MSLNPSLFHPRFYRSILSLWFRDVPQQATVAPPQALARWFGNSQDRATFDTQCSSTAEEALASINPERYPLAPQSSSTDAKIAEPFIQQLSSHADGEVAPEQTALALVVLLDQLSRNCFRNNQKDIYTHYDRLSQAVTKRFISRRLDIHERYRDAPPWRLWYYMPLMHSEDVADHEFFEVKMNELRMRMQQKHDNDAVEYVDMTVRFEQRHKDILDRFGRYPHRNKVMERDTTKEEEEYLQSGGETFGTG